MSDIIAPAIHVWLKACWIEVIIFFFFFRRWVGWGNLPRQQLPGLPDRLILPGQTLSCNVSGWSNPPIAGEGFALFEPNSRQITNYLPLAEALHH